MAKLRPQLAKLTRPRLHKAVARERLFAKLDEAREHKPAICVVGPPGAGKTTLVASWLDARGIKGIWYQVDPGDADLATFFYYLGQAVLPYSRKGQRALPLLTPEYLQDVEGFSRRFFRELFSRLPEGATLVLDNYQEVEAGQQFHQIVAMAISEVPQGVALVAISRRDPPDCYARLIANDNVAHLDWDEIKLSLDEAGAIGSLRHQMSAEEVALVYEQSGGWVAGFVLMLERLRRGIDITDLASTGALVGVFDYFAGQLFDQSDSATRDLLLRMSYLPRMSTTGVAALTGSPLAAVLLEDFYRRHLFTDRRMAQEPIYQFHALFHAFLQHRAQQALTRDEQTDFAIRAARIIDMQGHTEEAFPLFLRGGDFESAGGIVLRESARLIAQGRWQIVVDWIDSLPTSAVESHCWLLHWLGTAQIPVSPEEARAFLEASFELAVRKGDVHCQIQAAAGIIQTHIFQYARFRSMDPWIDALKEALARVKSFPSAEAELRAWAALLVALSFRKPDDPVLDFCTDRVFDLVQSGADLDLRTLAAAYLVAYGTRTGPLELARRARPLLEQLLAHPEVTSASLGFGWFMISFFDLVGGDEQKCRAAIREVERIGREEGLPSVSQFAAIIGAHVEFGVGNVEAARRWSILLATKTVSGTPYNKAISESIKAWIAMFDSDPASACASALQAVERFDEAGTHFLRCMSRIQLALSLTILGDFSSAQRWTSEALQLARSSRSLWLEAEVHFSEAFIALEQQDPGAASEALQLAFTLARRSGSDWPLRFIWLWAPRLCAEALQLGIEVEYVRDLIRRLDLPAPANREEEWPWPVKIHTLGQFRILVDENVLSFPHKAPRKPISLLKAIISFGGKEVPESKMMDALWPDEEGAAAREACKIALHRLRKVLGGASTVLVDHGRMSLNRSEVWVDAFAFELAADAGIDPRRIEALYRGQFLSEEPDAPWALGTRERLRGKFIRHVAGQGTRLEKSGEHEAAMKLYQRGIEADDLAEEFYRGLMRCHIERGRHADAMAVYRRLRQTLSVTLGIVPSRASDFLFRSVRQS